MDGGARAEARNRWRAVAIVAVAMVVTSACSSSSSELRTEGAFASIGRAATTTATTAVPTSTTTTTTPTTVPATTTTVPATTTTTRVPVTTVPVQAAARELSEVGDLGLGAQGVAVLALEQRLTELRYEVGTLDSVFDENTAHAVMAFQKTEGLARTGVSDPATAQALNRAQLPVAAVPGGGSNRVEVDLDRQVLRLYVSDQLHRTISVSTGNNEIFCSQGYCRRAVTPVGSYRIYEQRRGWETAPLGRLYNSQYFNGGIAVHGSTSVPAQPASHGCVRIPMAVAEWFPSMVSVGTPVYVFGNGAPPPPPLLG